MAERKALVIIGGRIKQLPPGDTLAGATGSGGATSLESVANSGTIADDVDYVVLTPTATAAWTLPTAIARTRPLYIMNKSSFQITFTPQGSETYNGDANGVFSAGFPYTSQVLIPIGGNWYVF